MDCLSQRDMFDASDSDGITKKKALHRISSTLDLSKTSHDHKFGGVVLFDHDVDAEKPFNYYKLSLFNDKDLKPEWLKKNLGVASRIIKLRRLSPFPGGVYSLFSKVEIGMKFIVLYK